MHCFSLLRKRICIWLLHIYLSLVSFKCLRFFCINKFFVSISNLYWIRLCHNQFGQVHPNQTLCAWISFFTTFPNQRQESVLKVTGLKNVLSCLDSGLMPWFFCVITFFIIEKEHPNLKTTSFDYPKKTTNWDKMFFFQLVPLIRVVI